MKSPHRPTRRAIAAALAACGLVGVAALANQSVLAGSRSAQAADPLLDASSRACAPSTGGQPALLRKLVLARTETAPFQPVPAKAAGGEVPLLEGLGTLTFKVTTVSAAAMRTATRTFLSNVLFSTNGMGSTGSSVPTGPSRRGRRSGGRRCCTGRDACLACVASTLPRAGCRCGRRWR